MSRDMQMTNEEIVKSYKEAKHKGQQIGILADLNVCPKDMIIDILVEGGIPKTAFSRYKGENNIKRVKREVKVHEKKRQSEEEAAIVKEAVLALWDKLSAEYKEIEAEWQRISAEYERKLAILDRLVGADNEQRAD